MVGVSVLAVIGVILIVYISTTNFGSSPSLVSRSYLSNTPKLIPAVAPRVTAQQSNNGQEIKHVVPLNQIVSGGPPPDGIPSIDNPKFVSVADPSKFLQDSDLVLCLRILYA